MEWLWDQYIAFTFLTYVQTDALSLHHINGMTCRVELSCHVHVELDAICFVNQSHKSNITFSILYTTIPKVGKQLGEWIHFSVRIRHKTFNNMTDM